METVILHDSLPLLWKPPFYLLDIKGSPVNLEKTLMKLVVAHYRLNGATTEFMVLGLSRIRTTS